MATSDPPSRPPERSSTAAMGESDRTAQQVSRADGRKAGEKTGVRSFSFQPTQRARSTHRRNRSRTPRRRCPPHLAAVLHTRNRPREPDRRIRRGDRGAQRMRVGLTRTLEEKRRPPTHCSGRLLDARSPRSSAEQSGLPCSTPPSVSPSTRADRRPRHPADHHVVGAGLARPSACRARTPCRRPTCRLRRHRAGQAPPLRPRHHG